MKYPWIGWEELSNWPAPDCYEAMLACCRFPMAQRPERSAPPQIPMTSLVTIG